MSERPSITVKTAADLRVTPPLLDFDAERARFSRDLARSQLAGFPNGALNNNKSLVK
jgi:hypothetical protein